MPGLFSLVAFFLRMLSRIKKKCLLGRTPYLDRSPERLGYGSPSVYKM